MTTAHSVQVLKTFELGSDQAVGHNSPCLKIRGKNMCRQSYLYLALGTSLQSFVTREKLA